MEKKEEMLIKKSKDNNTVEVLQLTLDHIPDTTEYNFSQSPTCWQPKEWTLDLCDLRSSIWSGDLSSDQQNYHDS